MKLFPINGRQYFFENTHDVAGESRMGFLVDEWEMALLQDHQNGYFSVRAMSGGRSTRQMYVACANYTRHNVCNWMIPATGSDPTFCLACELNEVIPNLGNPQSRYLWSKMEAAKHRLVYTLLRLELPVISHQADAQRGVAFQFLEDEPSAVAPGETFHIMTGHNQGVITMNLAEADDATREANRTAMGEEYRTLLGHFRHEIGHYYWDRLIRDTPRYSQFRELFGDDTADYQSCLQRHYNEGPADNWQDYYVSPYASSHPWEDWAECWGHYLYMVDALEFAEAAGLLQVTDNQKPPRIFDGRNGPLVGQLPEMLSQWLHLSTVLNSLNRIAGITDPNPFILSGLATRKMQFVHDVIREASQKTRQA